MHSKRGQWRLLSTLKTGVFGDGLLVRARSTTLVLLGFTAAVGLTMVALALNQGWTVIPGVPLPSLGDREQAVGDATVAAGAGAHARPAAASQSGAGRQGPNGSASHRATNGSGGKSAPGGSKAPGSDTTVVSHSTPAASPADDGASIPTPEPPAAAPTPEPASSPVTTPASERAPEPVAPSHATLASNDASGHDHGHHFGRAPSGHGQSTGGGHSDDAPESSDDSEQPSIPPPASDDPEGTHAPPWSHGHSHK